MPNWATNNVEVYGNKETLEKILSDGRQGTHKTYSNWNREKGEYDSFTEHPNTFSFQSLVPAPDLVFSKVYKAGEDNKDHAESFANAMAGNLTYAYDNLYDWHLAHWGTKWDIGQDEVYLGEVEQSGDEFVFKIGFNTAWSPACQFWNTLSEKYGVRVVNNYYEEGMDFIGTFEVDKGEILNDSCVSISNEMWKIAGAEFDENGEVLWGEGEVDLSLNFPIHA
jgi:hypothetical protein